MLQTAPPGRWELLVERYPFVLPRAVHSTTARTRADALCSVDLCADLAGNSCRLLMFAISSRASFGWRRFGSATGAPASDPVFASIDHRVQFWDRRPVLLCGCTAVHVARRSSAVRGLAIPLRLPAPLLPVILQLRGLLPEGSGLRSSRLNLVLR